MDERARQREGDRDTERERERGTERERERERPREGEAGSGVRGREGERERERERGRAGGRAAERGTCIRGGLSLGRAGPPGRAGPGRAGAAVLAVLPCRYGGLPISLSGAKSCDFALRRELLRFRSETDRKILHPDEGCCPAALTLMRGVCARIIRIIRGAYNSPSGKL